MILFVLLNPSTADGQTDDATLRRLIAFAKLWGFGSLVVVNLYAFRATNPGELRVVQDPIGPENRKYIILHALKADRVMCGWGNNAEPSRVAYVVDDIRATRSGLFKPNVLYCLGVTKQGQPLHPLRLRKDTKLREYAAL